MKNKIIEIFISYKSILPLSPYFIEDLLKFLNFEI